VALRDSADPPMLPIRDGVRPADVDRILARTALMLARCPGGALDCDVGDVTHPDLGTIEALARVGLIVRRRGGRLRLIGASVELLNLLSFCGLRIASVVEAERNAEEREEAGGVEEEGDPGDPVA
jgi:hypothetical protein